MPPSTSLNVIALISGGKDSLFSLLHCIHHGHRIVALANLYPAPTRSDEGCSSGDGEADDVNSFMYQTVGHSIVPLYAEALGLPLYRRKISGEAVNADREYRFTESGAVDETEDLIPLLQEIRQKFPQANAVSTGAILSTYQRTRVESVAIRLQLTPLAYLWQYPSLPPPIERQDSTAGLLEDMEAAGCDARLIKIASAGIKESLLWSRVSDPVVVKRLAASMSLFSKGNHLSFRAAIVGEGGEYETLALDGPAPLWKKRIHIDSEHNDIVRDEGGALRLTFGEAILVEQRQEQKEGHKGEAPVRIPAMFDDRFKQLLDTLSASEKEPEPFNMTEAGRPTICKAVSQNQLGFTLDNMTDVSLSINVTGQTAAIMRQVDDELEAARTSSQSILPRIVSTTILLRDMSDFRAVNDIYVKHFNYIHPPARVTICCGDVLQEGILVSMSFTGTTIDPARVSGLHVQSISHWAPANIGPYSQTISVPMSALERHPAEIVYMAGQIPLVPGSMQLSDGDDGEKTVLSLQHLWRIGQCVGVDWWTVGIAYLADDDIKNVQTKAQLAWQAWKGAHVTSSEYRHRQNEGQSSDDEDELDVWDLKYNNPARISLAATVSLAQTTTDSHLHSLPNPNVLAPNVSSSSSLSPRPNNFQLTIPPFLAVQVHCLPRSAPIEWHSLGLAHLAKYPTSTHSLHIRAETTEHYSISLCSWGRRLQQDVHHTDSPDQDPGTEIPDFFTIQIFTTTTSTATSTTTPPSIDTNPELITNTDIDTDTNPTPTTQHLQTALSSPFLTSHHKSRTFTNLTIYYSTITTNTVSAKEIQQCVFQSTTDSANNNNNNNNNNGDGSSRIKHPTNHTNHPSDSGDDDNDDGSGVSGTVIPCTTLWGEEGRQVAVAVSGQIHESPQIL